MDKVDLSGRGDEICALAANAFGLRDATARLLPGDVELNAAVTGTFEGEAGEFVLKVFTSGIDRERLEFQRDLLDHAAQRDAMLARRLPRFLGAAGRIVRVQFQGAAYDACLMSYLPGRVLADITPHAPELLRDLGSLLGRLDRALVDFDGTPAEARASDDPSWHLLDGPATIASRLATIEPGPQRRDLVTRVLDRYTDVVEPVLRSLRTGVVHHDANENNVLVAVDPSRAEVTGLIDFGDALRSAVVTEPAIAAAYAALGKRDPLTAMAQVISGYHGENALSDEELDVVFDLARLRLAVSVAISSARAVQGEANAYRLVSQAPAWAVLEALMHVHPRFASAVFRDAAGLAPLRRGSAFTRWSANASFSPVLGKALETAPRVDLSVASPLLINGARGDCTMAEWGAALEELRRRSDAAAAVGYHDESRRLYATSEAFAEDREDGPEPRTVHLGVDLFAPAGTAIHAPLDGHVLSVQRNPAPLDYGPTLILEHAPNGIEPFWTLYGHLDGEVLDQLAPGDEVRAGHIIARFGAEHENGGWPPHLHFQVILDRLDAVGDFPGVAAPSRRRVWCALSPDPARLLGLEICAAPETLTTTADLLASRRANFCRSMSLSYDRPLQMLKGRGTTLIDDAGLPYLDAVNNVPHVGHCHPRVVEAGRRQMAILNTNTRYLAAGLERYAAKLRAKLPAHLEVIYFVSSGSEANEVALRLARAAADGARDVLVQEHGYHGHTGCTVAHSHYKFAGPGGFNAPDDVHVLPIPDPYRGRHRGPASGPAYVRHVEDALEGLRARGRRPAAMLAEAIIGCGGQVVPPAGYLRDAFEAVRRAGGVAIADEVQVGFGRVGTHFWAFAEQDALPDIVTMGKPIGNGHPLAAVATTRAIADAFAGGMEFFATFGGNHVSIAIGEAVLDVIDDERLLDNVCARSAQFFTEMVPIAARHPCVGDVRGRGLYLGVDIVRDADTREPWPEAAHFVANRLRERRILISTDGPHRNVLKIKPPIVFSADEMSRLTAAIDMTLRESAFG